MSRVRHIPACPKEYTEFPERLIPSAWQGLRRCIHPHSAFVKKWDAATAALVMQGYLLPGDARTFDKVAAQSDVGGASSPATRATTSGN
jgi:hypothetical protein